MHSALVAAAFADVFYVHFQKEIPVYYEMSNGGRRGCKKALASNIKGRLAECMTDKASTVISRNCAALAWMLVRCKMHIEMLLFRTQYRHPIKLYVAKRRMTGNATIREAPNCGIEYGPDRTVV